MFRPATILRLGLCLLAGVSLPDAAAAGWICVRNETTTAIVIQDVPHLPLVRRGKSVRLLPGECYREFHPNPGEKKVNISDAKLPSRPLCTEKIAWQTGDLVLKVEVVERKVRLSQVLPPGAVLPAGVPAPVPVPPPPPPK